MTTKILKERESDKNLSDALARGALLWAPLYSVGAAGISHTLIADHTSEAVPFSQMLISALLILSPLCIFVEALGWALFHKLIRLKRLGNRKDALPKLPHFVPPLQAAKLRHRHA